MAPAPEWRTADVVRSARTSMGRGLLAGARVLEDAIRQTLSVPGGGRPSPPGRPPYRQSGALVGAVGIDVVSPDAVRVGITQPGQQPKAVRLARGFHGTDSLGRRYRQPARPYVTVAFRKVNKRLVAEALRRGG